ALGINVTLNPSPFSGRSFVDSSPVFRSSASACPRIVTRLQPAAEGSFGGWVNDPATVTDWSCHSTCCEEGLVTCRSPEEAPDTSQTGLGGPAVAPNRWRTMVS